MGETADAWVSWISLCDAVWVFCFDLHSCILMIVIAVVVPSVASK